MMMMMSRIMALPFRFQSFNNDVVLYSPAPLFGILGRRNCASISPPPSLSSSSSSKISIARASSASLSGSDGAPYSGDLVDSKTRQRKKKIAGIDQDELLDPTLLADPDSCFCEFKSVHIHHKLYIPDSQTVASLKLPFPLILLHGFGASVFSWGRVLKPLADLNASKVLAFDRPAFGLTSRIFPSPLSWSSSASEEKDTKVLNPYSMAFSVLATLHFIDVWAAEKAVLVGHSAGSFVAVNTYFEAPERVAALILVAPAILAPYTFRKAAKENKLESDSQTEGDKPNSFVLRKQIIKLVEILSKFAQAIIQMMKGMMDMVNTLYKKALTAILCSAFGVMLITVVIDKFGIAAVRNAWYDSNKVTDHVLNGYTKPLKAKDWDKALAEFTAATLASTESESKPPLSNRLHEILCPVLIITGDSDRIVPSWNAKRLSQAIPGSSLEVIKHCGHLPHEEKVEEFVSIVGKFLRDVFLDSKDLSLQEQA